MRWSKGFAGMLAGTGLCVAGAQVVAGCGKGLQGCEASRTCDQSPAGGEGDGSSADGASGEGPRGKGGTGGKGGGAGSGATASAAGESSSGGKGGSSTSRGGTGGSTRDDGGAAGETDPRAAGNGGGNVDSEGDGGREDDGTSGAAGEPVAGAPSDRDAPHILATSPTNGEKGVRSDAEIRVTFSERMDNESVEAAFHSDSLPAVKLLWDHDSTELVIQPAERLMYEDVTEPNAAARFYSFTIAGTAKDVAGNAMGDERTFVFTTLRHLEHTLSVPDKWARKLWHPANGDADTQALGCTSPTSKLSAGDADDDTALAFVVAFDLQTLPRGAVQWAKATLHAGLEASTMNPYPRLGSLQGYAVSAALDDVLWAVPTTGALGAVATYASSDHFDEDVLDFLPAAYTAAKPLEFLFRFETPTDGNGHDSTASVRCDTVSLDLEYWAP
jgi:hypothetical protein